MADLSRQAFQPSAKLQSGGSFFAALTNTYYAIRIPVEG